MEQTRTNCEEGQLEEEKKKKKRNFLLLVVLSWLWGEEKKRKSRGSDRKTLLLFKGEERGWRIIEESKVKYRILMQDEVVEEMDREVEERRTEEWKKGRVSGRHSCLNWDELPVFTQCWSVLEVARGEEGEVRGERGVSLQIIPVRVRFGPWKIREMLTWKT